MLDEFRPAEPDDRCTDGLRLHAKLQVNCVVQNRSVLSRGGIEGQG